MSRNAAGVYSLPTGNPVVTGSVISSTWANATMPDIGTELTSSLDRSGRGSMLAPLKNVDGLVGTPGMTFSNEPTSGFWRSAAGEINVAILAASVGKFNASGWAGNVTGTVTGHSSLDLALTGGALTGPVTATVAAAAALAIRSGAAGSYSLLTVGRTADEGYLGVAALANQFFTGTAAGDAVVESVNTNLWLGTGGALPIVFATSGIEKARLDANGMFGINRTPTSYQLDSRCDTTGAKQFRFGGAGLASLFGHCDAGGGGITNADPHTGGALVYLAGTAISMFTAGTNRLSISATGLFDSAGLELGYKVMPAGTVTTGTLTTAERGRCVDLTAGCTLPNGVFAAGDSFALFNTSLGAFTITQGAGLTLRLAGTASTGNRTLAGIGLATVRYFSSSVAVISGAGVS